METNKLNIAEILRNCPKGTKLYSPLCGECEIDFIKIREFNEDTIIKVKFLSNDGETHYIDFYYDGSYLGIGNGECLLFPSEENRDWSKVNKPKFDPKTLKPFDKVLVYSSFGWFCGIFSHSDNSDGLIVSNGSRYERVIPYNDDTKHLLGTTDEAAEFYRYWED